MHARRPLVLILVVILSLLAARGVPALEPRPAQVAAPTSGEVLPAAAEPQQVAPPAARRDAPIAAASSWHTTVVESGVVPRYISLALDGAGHPHISYYDYLTLDLKYAHHDGTTWHVETVDQEGNVGWDTSIAVDSLDRPHIAYFDYTDWSLNYAFHDGSRWYTETVDQGGHTGWEPSIALDSLDHPHIGYYDVDNHTIKYAYDDGTGWHLEVVEGPLGALSGAPSLALDSADQPHVSYGGGLDLKYASFDGTRWYSETVLGSAYGVALTSLALDSTDRPHMAAELNGYEEALVYAWREGTGWQIETLANKPGEIRHALALDSTDWPHISYSDRTSHLVYTHLDGSGWHPEMPDPQAEHVGDTALALDAAGYAHIAYQNAGELLYAHAFCVPVQSAQIAGPDRLSAGVLAVYTATYLPITATEPLATWSDGTAGLTSTRIWTVTGTYSLAATVTNACGSAQDSISVTVFCQPPEAIMVRGPLTLLPSQAGTYWAAPFPITTSLPISWSWDDGTVTTTASYSWPATGTYTVVVTGTNACGQRQGTLEVLVLPQRPYAAYLPLALRAWGSARDGTSR